MGKKVKEYTQHIVVHFSDQANDTLAHLSNQLGCGKSQIFRNSLLLYSYIVDNIRNNNCELAFLSSDDKIKKVILVPGLQHTSSKNKKPLA